MDIEKNLEIPSSPKETEITWPEPLPRQRGPNQDVVLKVFRKERPSLEIISHVSFHSGPVSRRKSYQVTFWSWMASFIDALILVSVSCIFLLAFSYVIRTTTDAGLHGIRIEKSLEKDFLAVFLLCSWVYMVTLRVLIGSSVGEWACDLRLGQPHERLHTVYPLRVILRESLVLMTGLITLPILSLLLQKDIAGKISGLKLFSLK